MEIIAVYLKYIHLDIPMREEEEQLPVPTNLALFLSRNVNAGRVGLILTSQDRHPVGRWVYICSMNGFMREEDESGSASLTRVVWSKETPCRISQVHKLRSYSLCTI